MRLTSEELQDVMRKYKVSQIWSWSKVKTFMTSWFEFYLKYVIKAKEDRSDSIYTTTGGMSHEILENFYTSKISYEQMEEDFDDGWTTAFDIVKLKFDRNNEEHNDKIADKYYRNLKHFFANHTPIRNKVVIEQFITAMIDGNLFQGYIDCCFKDDEGNIHIIDFKTSSIYKGKKAEEECGQLVLYAIGMNQSGVPMDKIKICWNFLKYASVQITQKNGSTKFREIERTEIGEKLQTNAKMWLKEYCSSADEVDNYLKMLLDTNSIECLPEEVQKKYVISDCYVYVPLTDELVSEWIKSVSSSIKDIKWREESYRTNKANGLSEVDCSKVFWDSFEMVEKNSFYFSTLCGYSPALHLPYAAYLDRLERQKNGQDTFGGLSDGESDYESIVISGNKSENPSEGSNSDSDDDNIDLSWLDSL